MTDDTGGAPYSPSESTGLPPDAVTMHLTSLDAATAQTLPRTFRAYNFAPKMTFELMSGPRWRLRNACAWGDMLAQETEHIMNHPGGIDLRAVAERVFECESFGYSWSDPRGESHPEPLYEFTHHGAVCPEGWFMVVALTSSGLTAVMPVVRMGESDGEGDGTMVMRTGYAHPSPEYAGEIARQIYAGTRRVWVWDVTDNRWTVFPVNQALVFERLDHETWRETHRFQDAPENEKTG